MKAHNPADGLGAAQGKSGGNRKSLDRSAGNSATSSAVQSKTRSQHKGSSKHNHYEGCSFFGDNENVLGQ